MRVHVRVCNILKIKQTLWCICVHIFTLLHERADGEPQAVHNCELILHYTRVDSARMRILPLVRAEACQKKYHETNDQIGGYDIQPYLDG